MMLVAQSNKVTLNDIAQFIWLEADLLDKKDYDAWLELWNTNGHYVIPIEKDGDDFANMLNVAYDDADMRQMRVQRLQGGFSISAAPPAETIRTISRFIIDTQDEGFVHIRCAEHLVEDKFGRQRVFAANLTYKLQITDEGFKIQDKVARLLNSDGVLTSISYLF